MWSQRIDFTELYYVSEVPNVHVNENNESVYFFRRIFFQAV